MTTPTDTDTFEISLRVLGNEVIGMRLTSQSKVRTWVALAMICLVVLVVVAMEAAPFFANLTQIGSGP